MADEAVVTDSASVAETAPPEVAVEQTDVTHGDTTEQAPPTDDTATAEETPTEDDGDEDEESDEHQTEEEKTKAQKRRERREKREQERIEKTVSERLEQAERAREVKAHQESAEKQTKEAAEAWHKEFGDLLGTPEIHSQLEQDIAALTRETVAIRPYETDDPDAAVRLLEEKQKVLHEKIAQRDQLKTNQATYDKIDKYQFQMTQDIYLRRAASLPPEHAKLYLQSGDPDTALTRLEAGIVAREAAKHEAEKAAAVKAITADLEKERAAHAATRTGGPGSGPVPATGGIGASGAMTRDQFLALPKDQKDKIRRERPALVAEIYSRSA